MTFDIADPAREVGGSIRVGKGEAIQLRIFLDHSALEVSDRVNIFCNVPSKSNTHLRQCNSDL